MHRIDDVEFGQPLMGDFLFDQHFGNHADYLAAFGQHGVRENLHQAEVGSAINKAKVSSDKFSSKAFGDFSIFRLKPRA